MRITMMAAALAALVSLAPERTMAQAYPPDLPPDASTSGTLAVGGINTEWDGTDGYFNYPGDVDAFRFNLVAGKSYAIAKRRGCTAATLTLLNSAFKRLAILEPEVDTLHQNKTIEFTAKYTGLYFLKVIDRGIYNDDCPQNPGPGDYGENGWYYVIAKESCPPNSSTKCTFKWDQLYGVYFAGGVLEGYNDKDWQVFNVTKAGTYEVSLWVSYDDSSASAVGLTETLRRADSTFIADATSLVATTCHVRLDKHAVCLRRKLAVGKYYLAVWMPNSWDLVNGYYMTATKVAN